MRSWSCGILFSAAAAAAAGPQDFFGGNNHEDYLSWFNDNGLSYETSTFLPQLSDDMQGMSLHWNVDETHLTLAVAVRATGWVAFGLSENGGMAGADVFFYQVASEKLTDGHILDDKIMPFEDCQQDWELVSSMHDEDSEFLIVEVRRLLDTKDPQDRVIIEDGTLELPPSLVIGAWGDGEMSFHGEKRARSAIRWYNHELSGEEAFSTLMNQESEGHFQMQARDHQIKTIETEYVDICFTWDDLLAQGIPDGVFNVVGFRPIVEAVEHLVRSKTYYRNASNSHHTASLHPIWFCRHHERRALRSIQRASRPRVRMGSWRASGGSTSKCWSQARSRVLP